MEFPLETGLNFERASYGPLLHSKNRLKAFKPTPAAVQGRVINVINVDWAHTPEGI